MVEGLQRTSHSGPPAEGKRGRGGQPDVAPNDHRTLTVPNGPAIGVDLAGGRDQVDRRAAAAAISPPRMAPWMLLEWRYSPAR